MAVNSESRRTHRAGDWTSWVWLTSLLPVAVLSVATSTLLVAAVNLVAWVWPFAPLQGTPVDVFPWGGSWLWLAAPGAVWVAGWVLLMPLSERLGRSWWQTNTRPLTDQEAQQVHGWWDEVTRAAGRPGLQVEFAVSRDDDGSVASVVNQRQVVFTPSALTDLPAPQVRAVLAHELGHRVGWHPAVLRLVGRWMVPALTVRDLADTVRERMAVLFANSNPHGNLAAALYLVGIVLLLVATGVCWFFTLLTAAQQSLRRSSEVQADLFALRIGYGRSLVHTLSNLPGYDETDRRSCAAWQHTHPVLAHRIRRVTRTMSRPGRRGHRIRSRQIPLEAR